MFEDTLNQTSRGSLNFKVGTKTVHTFTALFTNMRILKFKSQLTIAFFAALNHLNGPLYFDRFKRSWFLICDWRISIRFVCWCVPFGESKNGFLILDLLDFAVERNLKSKIGFVTLAMHLSLETPTLGRYGALLGVCRGLCSVNWAEGMGN